MPASLLLNAAKHQHCEIIPGGISGFALAFSSTHAVADVPRHGGRWFTRIDLQPVNESYKYLDCLCLHNIDARSCGGNGGKAERAIRLKNSLSFPLHQFSLLIFPMRKLCAGLFRVYSLFIHCCLYKGNSNMPKPNSLLPIFRIYFLIVQHNFTKIHHPLRGSRSMTNYRLQWLFGWGRNSLIV